MKKRVMTVIRYLLLALAAIIVGIGIQSVVASNLAGNAVPMPFGIGTSVVMSGSMEPELKVGDLVIIKEYDEDSSPELQTGDVIVYQTGTTAVVHRIVDIDGSTITTQGDANNTADEPFDISAVKGTVVCSIPMIGYLALYVKTPVGIIAVLALTIFLLEYSFRREKREKEEQLEAIKEEIRELMEAQAEETKARNEDDL